MISLPIRHSLYAPFISQVGLRCTQISPILILAFFLGTRGTGGNVSGEYKDGGREDSVLMALLKAVFLEG